MFKILVSFILTTLLLTTVSSGAEPQITSDREEMRAVKMEQARLNSKERLLKLKQALNLEETQMDAWAAYENKVQEHSGQRMQGVNKLKQKHAGTGKAPSSIEIAEVNITRLEHKLATARERLAVFSDLYQVLNEEQRATVDKLTLRKVRHEAKKARNRRQ